jgi:molybdate transport system substrate-binding protein
VLLTAAPSGDHLLKVIGRMGMTGTVAPKLERFDTSTLLHRRMVETAGALGFGPKTEIVAWSDRGLAWAGAIPDEIQIVLPYAAAMLTRTTVRDEARALLAFLTTPQARQHFLDSGVE